MTKNIQWRVINCKVHENRLKKFKEKARLAGIPHVTRVSCINGRKFTDGTFCSLIHEGILNDRAELTPTEVAICLSHAKCWRQLLNSKDDYMVVFEDDCRPYRSFMSKFQSVMDSDLDFDILWLYNGNWKMTKNAYKKVSTVEKIPIYRETKPYIASASCYILTRKWAQTLYDKMFPIMYAVDDFMGRVNITHAKHYTVANKKAKNASYDCFTISPFVYVPCPSEGNTTQSYHSITIDERKLKHCKSSKN
jgi:GR25 family glycosyltransferase involved in LPS biosynthesis